MSSRRFVFFFSSRRRHTRLQGDWSSDVCSSDLPVRLGEPRTGSSPTPPDGAFGRRFLWVLPTLCGSGSRSCLRKTPCARLTASLGFPLRATCLEQVCLEFFA